MMAAIVTVSVGEAAITSQQTLARRKPIVMARIGFSFLANAVIGMVTRMIVQASTVSISSKRGNFRTSRT
jgi:hypothetical protein